MKRQLPYFGARGIASAVGLFPPESIMIGGGAFRLFNRH